MYIYSLLYHTNILLFLKNVKIFVTFPIFDVYTYLINSYTGTSPQTLKKKVDSVTVRAFCLVDGKPKLQKRRKFKNKI